MKFCDQCHNMMYVNIDVNKKLVYYCKSCGNKNIYNEGNSVCIIDDNKINDDTKYSQYINKYLKYDPCLPRVNNIECPNVDCVKEKEQDNEVIYIKYDPINMKYLYHCCHCDHFWINNV